MCSELTPHAPIPDDRREQIMQPWCTLIPVSIDLCTVRRDGAPDFRRIYVPIFGIMTILIRSGAPGFSSGAHFLQGWLAQGHISQKKRKWSKSGALRFSRAWVAYISKGRQCLVETKATYVYMYSSLIPKKLGLNHLALIPLATNHLDVQKSRDLRSKGQMA